MTADTFLFNAGSIFFAAWMAIIAALTITAFGRDLLPAKTPFDSPPKKGASLLASFARSGNSDCEK